MLCLMCMLVCFIETMTSNHIASLNCVSAMYKTASVCTADMYASSFSRITKLLCHYTKRASVKL